MRAWLLGVAGPACVAVGALLAPVAWATYSVPQPPSEAIDSMVVIDPAGYHPPAASAGTPGSRPPRASSGVGHGKPPAGSQPLPTAIGAATSVGSASSPATVDPGSPPPASPEVPPAEATSAPAAPPATTRSSGSQQSSTTQSSTGPQVVPVNPVREVGDGESTSHPTSTATSGSSRSASPTPTPKPRDSRDGE